MKALVKIKFWPLVIVGFVWLFATIVPFVNKSARLLSAAATEIICAIFLRALTTEYTVVAMLLGPLAPAAGSDMEIILRAGLIIATTAAVGLLIELPWRAGRRRSQQPQMWICNACSVGSHQRCRGALLLVSHIREGARACECQHCALNR